MTPLHDNPLTRSTDISKNGHEADKPVITVIGSAPTSMSLVTSLTMMVLGPGFPFNLVYLLCANFLKFPLIVFVDCHVMESKNLFVVSVEYFQSKYFPAQKLV